MDFDDSSRLHVHESLSALLARLAARVETDPERPPSRVVNLERPPNVAACENEECRRP